MEANARAKKSPKTDPESLKSYRAAVEVLRQRPSLSVFVVPVSPGEGARTGGCAADAEQDQPRASEVQLTGETENGSDARKGRVTPEGSPPEGSRARPEPMQAPDPGDPNGQQAGEGDKSRGRKADKDGREPSTASANRPASPQTANQRVLRPRFSRGRDRGRKHRRAPSEALAAKGIDSAPPALVGASDVTSVPRQKSRSLSLPDGTAAGTSPQHEAEVSPLLEQLEHQNTVKHVRTSRSADPVLQPNRAPRQSSASRQPSWRQQHRRQFLLKPLCKRMALHVMLPQGHEEAQKICFVLSEVAKAFHCEVDVGEAFQDAADCRRRVYLPVGPSTYTPFVPAADTCSWPHPHAHGSRAERKVPRRGIQRGIHKHAPRERQMANRFPDQLTRGALSKEVLPTLYPEVILSESPAEFISGEAARKQDEC